MTHTNNGIAPSEGICLPIIKIELADSTQSSGLNCAKVKEKKMIEILEYGMQ